MPVDNALKGQLTTSMDRVFPFKTRFKLPFQGEVSSVLVFLSQGVALGEGKLGFQPEDYFQGEVLQNLNPP
jgi:hypothetical protein